MYSGADTFSRRMETPTAAKAATAAPDVNPAQTSAAGWDHKGPARSGSRFPNVEGGLPHSEIAGSKLIRSSPTLIAAYHVLHRLCMPRHPPNALTTLDRSHCRCPSIPSASAAGSDRIDGILDQLLETSNGRCGQHAHHGAGPRARGTAAKDRPRSVTIHSMSSLHDVQNTPSWTAISALSSK